MKPSTIARLCLLIVFVPTVTSLIISSVYAGKKKFKTISFGHPFLPAIVKVQPNKFHLTFRQNKYLRTPQFKIEGTIPLKAPTVVKEILQPDPYPKVTEYNFGDMGVIKGDTAAVPDQQLAYDNTGNYPTYAEPPKFMGPPVPLPPLPHPSPKRMGINSGLHIIIFDEIDAICKARGSVAGNTGVHDTVVNQLLAKIDGVESLNNILVIGMTNRRDMIDEALLRPGRMEVQMEISLPNEQGRVQILNIHTANMRKYNKMDRDVDVLELASLTKNFSGAEIEGLVRAAQSTAMNRLVKADKNVQLDPEAFEKLLISRTDFLHALDNDVKPAFGTSSEAIERYYSTGIITWGQPVQDLIDDGQLFIQQ
ncbi:unnamed protein product, partial [Oppiella nova]